MLEENNHANANANKQTIYKVSRERTVVFGCLVSAAPRTRVVEIVCEEHGNADHLRLSDVARKQMQGHEDEVGRKVKDFEVIRRNVILPQHSAVVNPHRDVTGGCQVHTDSLKPV